MEPEDGLSGPGVTLKGQGSACAVFSVPLALWPEAPAARWPLNPPSLLVLRFPAVSPHRPHRGAGRSCPSTSDLSV